MTTDKNREIMKLHTRFAPRANWREKVHEAGVVYHTDPDGTTYWAESTAVAFPRSEVDAIKEATAECWQMYVQAMEEVATDVDRMRLLGLRKELAQAICNSWKRDMASLVGRFDFMVGPDGIKLLELNAQVPGTLPECAKAQREWFEDRRAAGELPQGASQCNDIWERLVAQWSSCGLSKSKPVYIAAAWDKLGEDMANAALVRDAAIEAGYKAVLIDIDRELNLADADGKFYFAPFITEEWLAETSDDHQRFIETLVGTPIEQMMMYFPWEWSILPDENGELPAFADALLRNIEDGSIRVINPLYSLLMSSKLMLPELARKFWESPYVLDAVHGYDITTPMQLVGRVEKPAFGWQGGNVKVFDENGMLVASTPGNFGRDGNVITQERCVVPGFKDADGDTVHLIVSTWVIGGKCTGIGVNGSTQSGFMPGQTAPVMTSNNTRFYPHYVV